MKPGRGKGHWEQLPAIKLLHAQGNNQVAIGKILGMSQKTVSRLLQGDCKQLRGKPDGGTKLP